MYWRNNFKHEVKTTRVLKGLELKQARTQELAGKPKLTYFEYIFFLFVAQKCRKERRDRERLESEMKQSREKVSVCVKDRQKDREIEADNETEFVTVIVSSQTDKVEVKERTKKKM